MQIIQLFGEKYTLTEELRWVGRDPTIVKFLNDQSQTLLESLGPADGFPTKLVLHDIVDRFGATILHEEEEEGPDEERIY